MQYKSKYRSSPIRIDQKHVIDLDGTGDTVMVSIETSTDTDLNFEDIPSLALTPKPAVMLKLSHKDTVINGSLGDDIIVEAFLKEPLPDDVSVDFSIQASTVPDWKDFRQIKSVLNTPDTFDYDTFKADLDLTGLSTTAGTITITAGNLSGNVSITSTAKPPAELFYGKGSYYVAEVVLGNVVSTSDVMLHSHQNRGYIFLEDNNTYPKWDNYAVQLWGKIEDVSYWQPLPDPATGNATAWTFGYYRELDSGGNSVLTDDPTLATRIFDDVPIDKVELRPVDKNLVPEDIQSVTGSEIDLTNRLPYYTVKIITGRRE